jgi:hypothetical protein
MSYNNLSTWECFGWCWEKMKEKYLIGTFMEYLELKTDYDYTGYWVHWELKSPRERCNLIWEFIKSRKEV